MAETGTEARPPLLRADAALFLDFDGTLVAYAPHPDGVMIDAGLPELLARLRECLHGALAIISGRSLDALDKFIAPPRYAAAGLHGLEWRLAAGRTRRIANPTGASDILGAILERFGGDSRIVVEDKGTGVALHWRRAPERAAECIAFMREIVTSPDLEVLRGHAVVEARPRGVHKGAALRELSRHAPFAGRKPVYVGDDRTDEDGFRAALVAGGHGVKVGPEPSEARYRLSSVEAVHAWLAASLAALDTGANR